MRIALTLTLALAACTSIDSHYPTPPTVIGAVQSMPIETAMRVLDEAMNQPGWSKDPFAFRAAPLKGAFGEMLTCNADVQSPKVPIRYADLGKVSQLPDSSAKLMTVQFDAGHDCSAMLYFEADGRQASEITTALQVLRAADRAGRLEGIRAASEQARSGRFDRLSDLQEYIVDHPDAPGMRELIARFVELGMQDSQVSDRVTHLEKAAPAPGAKWHVHKVAKILWLSSQNHAPLVMTTDYFYEVLAGGKASMTYRYNGESRGGGPALVDFLQGDRSKMLDFFAEISPSLEQMPQDDQIMALFPLRPGRSTIVSRKKNGIDATQGCITVGTSTLDLTSGRYDVLVVRCAAIQYVGDQSWATVSEYDYAPTLGLIVQAVKTKGTASGKLVVSRQTDVSEIAELSAW